MEPTKTKENKFSGIRLGIVDRALSMLSPRVAQRRLMDRVAYNNSVSLLSNQGYITKDSPKRSMRGWQASANSANVDILPKSNSLRASSRDLYMNAPLAHAAIQRYSTNALGLGLKCKPQIEREFLGFTGDSGKERAKDWERNTQREWEAYSESFFSDAELSLNVNENAVLAFSNMLLSGDSFVALPGIKLPGQIYNTKVKVIESDYCSNPQNIMETFRTAGGIDVNKLGAPIAYHFSKPDMNTSLDFGMLSYNKWERIPRFNSRGLQQVLHLFTKFRPGQRRGVPLLAPVIEDIKQKTRYKGSALDAAILNSMFTVFIKSMNNIAGNQLTQGYIPPSLDVPIGSPGASVKKESNPADEKIYEIGQANILELDENQDISLADPKHPVLGYDKFADSLAKEIGAALGLPYEVLMLQFNSSFSASKAALQEAWKMFLKYRVYMIDHYYNPIYETFMWEAIGLGRIDAPGFYDDPIIRKAWLRTDWIGAGQGMIDPMKETTAAEKRIKNRITTREREYQQLVGGDWFVAMTNFSKEIDHLDELDINPDKLEQQKADAATNKTLQGNNESPNLPATTPNSGDE